MSTTTPRRWAAVLASAVCGLALVGCSVVDPPGHPDLDVERPRPTAGFADARCPRDGVGLGAGDLRLGPGPTAGLVPAGFTPTRVRRCRLRDDPVQVPGGLRYTVDEETSDVGPAFLATLTLPDQELDPRGHEVCAAVYRPPVYLLLLDGRGRAVRPVLPAEPCGDPRAEVAAAVRSLAPTEVTAYTFVVAPEG